jgi:uncharacterized lipoprotein YehR (DUF1307 family)
LIKLIITTLAIFTLLGSLVGNSEAMKNMPFEYQASGIEITNFNLDYKDIEIILDVEVTESLGIIEITFEREFFDSNLSGIDKEFTIIADGELVDYQETQTTLQHRTLSFNLISGTDEVEIFGSQLMGIPIIEAQTEEQEPPQLFNDQSEKIDELSIENKKLKTENEFLKEENEILDSRIFELENLVSALEHQVHNLNAIVQEQVSVIYNWVLGPYTQQ